MAHWETVRVTDIQSTNTIDLHLVDLEDGRRLRLEHEPGRPHSPLTAALVHLKPTDDALRRYPYMATTRIQVEGKDIVAITGARPRIRSCDLAVLRAMDDVDEQEALRWANEDHAEWRKGEMIPFPGDGVNVADGMIVVMSGGGDAWYTAGEMIVGELPETFRTAVPGMELRRIVSDPVLDRAGLVVAEIVSATGDGYTRLRMRGWDCIEQPWRDRPGGAENA